MRTLLAPFVGQRRCYRARFVCFGDRKRADGSWCDTALLTDVRDAADGVTLTDHLWLSDVAPLRPLRPLDGGDIIEFSAIARYYDATYGMDVELAEVQDVSFARVRTPRREEVAS